MATTETVSIGDPTKLSHYDRLLTGYIGLSMTNIANTSEPLFSRAVEVNGVAVTLSGDSGTGWSGLSTSSDVWVYVQSDGAVVYSATAPSWDSSKTGWYNGNDRAVAWMRKDSGNNYRYKHFLPHQQQSMMLFTEVIDIGDWNMDTTDFLDVAHELDFTTIKSLAAYIRRDDNSQYFYASPSANGAGDIDLRFSSISSTNMRIYRGALLNNANFDSTSYNRGEISITHRAL